MSIIGQIAPFDEAIEDFESYCERVSLYFTANDIKDEKKVPVFLTLVGAKIYTLAKNLLSPKDPAKYTISEITNVRMFYNFVLFLSLVGTPLGFSLLRTYRAPPFLGFAFFLVVFRLALCF